MPQMGRSGEIISQLVFAHLLVKANLLPGRSHRRQISRAVRYISSVFDQVAIRFAVSDQRLSAQPASGQSSQIIGQCRSLSSPFASHSYQDGTGISV